MLFFKTGSKCSCFKDVKIKITAEIAVFILMLTSLVATINKLNMYLV